MIALVIGLGGAIALWTYDLGRSFTFGKKVSVERLDLLQKQVEELIEERDRLALTATTAESQQNIALATRTQLAEQIKTLTADNLKLKDDLAFFETLLPSATRQEGISIQRIKAEMVAPNQLRYRVLLMQGGKDARDFSGEAQFTLTLLQGGKSAMMVYPDPKAGEPGKIKLLFKHYQRLEGLITLSEGATVKAIQVKVIDKGVQRAQQSINL